MPSGQAIKHFLIICDTQPKVKRKYPVPVVDMVRRTRRKPHPSGWGSSPIVLLHLIIINEFSKKLLQEQSQNAPLSSTPLKPFVLSFQYFLILVRFSTFLKKGHQIVFFQKTFTMIFRNFTVFRCIISIPKN